MNIRELAGHIDHTLLKPDSTETEIAQLCDEAIAYGAASVCIPPSFVEFASKYLNGKVKVCTVIGFPNGYSTQKTKVSETAEAVADGADEIDMVINIGALKAGHLERVVSEITAVRAECPDKILKVIIECCLLTDDEKRAACRCVTAGGADYVKTSTGFSSGGATIEDVKLLRQSVPDYVKVKAAGGIRTAEQGEAFLDAGAERIGSSNILKIR